MKKAITSILFLYIFYSCAAKPVHETKVIEPVGGLEVAALLAEYKIFISEVAQKDDDVGFLIGGKWIYFYGGRMLTEKSSLNEDKYQSIFYDYAIGKIEKLPGYQELTLRSSDFLDHLFGTSEIELRTQCDWVPFLEHKAYMNHFCEEALSNVEEEILKAAQTDQEVQAFIDNLDTIFSFQLRNIRGTNNVSYHSYGLALDLVPTSYNKKHANWKWSTALVDEWHTIPLEERWSPPQKVIDAFEKNGFVWGGKWSHFDNIHFEYAPEIILLAKSKALNNQ